MSCHHWMYCGCQCSSARCRRLFRWRSTLLGIFSAEIMVSIGLGIPGFGDSRIYEFGDSVIRGIVDSQALESLNPRITQSPIIYVLPKSNSARSCDPYDVRAPLGPTAFGRWKIQFCQAVSRPKIRVSMVSGPTKRRRSEERRV